MTFRNDVADIATALSQMLPQVSEADQQNARLVVAGLSHDNEDCALLLTTLGLMEEEA